MNDKIIGRPIRLNKQILSVKKGKNYAEVCFIGDCHYGSPQCDTQRFRDMLDYCMHKGVYVMLMGDLLEMATRDSIGAGVYEQESVGQTQYEEMVEILSPLAKAKLILGSLRGNHEMRTYQSCGVDIAKALAREIGVPYLHDACWNLFRVGKHRYSVYVLHGRTAAQYDGTVLKCVENVSDSFYADLVAMGHAHKLVQGSLIVETVVGHQVVQKKKFVIVTGSFLKYDGSYWQQRGGQISKLGSPKVKFFSDRHDLSISW